MSFNLKNDYDTTQLALPPQPLPSIEATSYKLLEWAKPLLDNDEYQASLDAVMTFCETKGSGEQLQQALLQAEGRYWSGKAWQDHYLRHRDSLAIHSNVFYYLESQLHLHEFSPVQIAAALAISATEFMLEIQRGTLSQDFQGKAPLCMDQYQQLFGATRIPGELRDRILIHPKADHMMVMVKQQFFPVRLFDAEGNIRHYMDLSAELDAIKNSAIDEAVNIGIMTGANRAWWAKKREYIKQHSKRNQTCFEQIEHAAFVLCLDEDAPQLDNDIAQKLLHGKGCNRYFDKVLQFIVFNNGKSGINYEHTGIDGSVMLRLIRHLYDTIPLAIDDTQKAMPLASTPSPLTWTIDSTIEQAISHAEEEFARHCNGYQTQVIHFNAFGQDAIKQRNISPDAFVQLALQLAEFRSQGTNHSAYEAIMTRAFDQGRIDVLYTVTPEAQHFIRAFAEHRPQAEIANALRDAATAHIGRAKECQKGSGIATHLLALEYSYEHLNAYHSEKERPELFQCPAYQKLMHTIICTSTTSYYGVLLAGYGPVVDGGYGLRYFKRANELTFIATCQTKTYPQMERYLRTLEQTLHDMYRLLAE